MHRVSQPWRVAACASTESRRGFRLTQTAAHSARRDGRTGRFDSCRKTGLRRKLRWRLDAASTCPTGRKLMRVLRPQKYQPLLAMHAVARSPIIDPVCGDVLQDKDGERRSVEIHERGDRDKVRYRRAGASLSGVEAATQCECDISAWRRWASEAEVLHAAHKPLAAQACHKLTRGRAKAGKGRSRALSRSGA
jgi:hypothetical protein